MKSGHADLPLHYGRVPEWLAQRMSLLGGAIVESIVIEYGRDVLLQKLSDPFWFQSLGCVLGMDWHSSGITTSVMNALKRSVNKRSADLGIYICGGRGKQSRQTPAELLAIADKTGLDGNLLVHNSRLSAKVDNTAIQDGFQLYLHSFVVSKEGNWAVVQQGMNTDEKMARRYHWHSPSIKSFIEEPHTSIYGKNQGIILNLTDKAAAPTRSGILELTTENPDKIMREVRKLIMPEHHDVRAEDVNLKRLGSVLALAHDNPVQNMESLLLLEGVGPRTIQSLTLVSEIIHSTPSRFSDPARFSFAHGGKDGHPFPVPITIYDESIQILDKAVQKARLGDNDKSEALKNLSKVSAQLEKDFQPNNRFDDLIQEERNNSWKYEGRTVMGKAKKPKGNNGQLELF
ncbi:DUF763 domain-containing protein [Dyadobacter subterraneus]|uniref:DUF763 domain-containing protein n=1 Tax=Dyadobacter subterraneus TaxID=2773304 RepID=A0ABR9W578_9BACT|nr:DUF763 domain-containing protein [Dyadobacter subterraneus]MBE9460314.1 DUF763 domain-containing protein [Dyadobacter subterraneus]